MSENRPSLALLKLDLKLYYTFDKCISITNNSTVSFHKKLDSFKNYWFKVKIVFCILFISLAVYVLYLQRVALHVNT